MKKSRFTDGSIMETLNPEEACIKVADLCRELGISSYFFTAGAPSTATCTSRS